MMKFLSLSSFLVWYSSLFSWMVMIHPSFVLLVVHAQMDCNYDKAQVLSVGRFKIFVADMAATNSGFYIPDKVNFHIYYMPSGTQPRWQSAPGYSYVEPRRNGDILRFYYTQAVGFREYKPVDSGIALWVPWDWIQTIATASSRGDTIKIQNVETDALPAIAVIDAGSGNRWKISSDSSPVMFTGLADNTQMEAKIKSGSQFFFRGNTNSRLNLIYGNDLDVQLLGDNSKMFLVGRYRQINMIGSNNKVRINDDCNNCQGCNNVAGNANNGNTCETTTDGFEAIAPPACTISALVRPGVSIVIGSSKQGGGSSASTFRLSYSVATLLFGWVSAAVLEMIVF